MTEISITIKEANEAIEYWLNNAVLKDSVGVKDIEWLAQNYRFRIEMETTPMSEEENDVLR